MDACVQLPPGFGPVGACPPPLLHKRLPERWMATLRYEGSAADIADGWHALLGQWLPQAAYQLAIGPFRERYDPELCAPGGRQVRCELGMPVEPRVA
jgi:predicted transcriptional regulator YdeE